LNSCANVNCSRDGTKFTNPFEYKCEALSCYVCVNIYIDKCNMQHLNIGLSNWTLWFKCPLPKRDMIHKFMHKKFDFCIPLHTFCTFIWKLYLLHNLEEIYVQILSFSTKLSLFKISVIYLYYCFPLILMIILSLPKL
jgi:hypothetical protein